MVVPVSPRNRCALISHAVQLHIVSLILVVLLRALALPIVIRSIFTFASAGRDGGVVGRVFDWEPKGPGFFPPRPPRPACVLLVMMSNFSRPTDGSLSSSSATP